MGVHSSVGVVGAGAYLLGLLFLGAGGGFVTEGFLTNNLLAGELSVDLGLGLPEVLSGRRTARERLRASQLEQELGTLIRRRRLRERAPEVGRGAVGSALPEGRPSGPPQRLDDPLVAAGGYGKEVGGHLLDWRAPLREQSRGPLVQDLPHPGRHVTVDGGGHQRMSERQRRLSLQDLRPQELGRAAARTRFVKAGEHRDGGELRAVAAHGDCPRHAHCVLGETCEPQ